MKKRIIAVVLGLLLIVGCGVEGSKPVSAEQTPKPTRFTHVLTEETAGKELTVITDTVNDKEYLIVTEYAKHYGYNDGFGFGICVIELSGEGVEDEQ